jgi:hypothetical protein
MRARAISSQREESLSGARRSLTLREAERGRGIRQAVEAASGRAARRCAAGADPPASDADGKTVRAANAARQKTRITQHRAGAGGKPAPMPHPVKAL